MKDKILEICKENNGYITGKMAKDKGIPSTYLSRMAKEESLKRVAPGIYLNEEVIEDEFYIYYLSYPNIIFYRETALYLNGLSNNMLSDYYAILPYECNVPKNTNLKIKRTRKDTIDVGVTIIDTPYGNKCKCYDKERCICDLFIYDDFEYEEKAYAINTYKEKYLNKEKLYSYAKKLGVYKEVFNVFEVIAWTPN